MRKLHFVVCPHVRALLACLVSLFTLGPAAAQDVEPAPPFRQLAPGVEITIPASLEEAETVSKADVVEILQGVPGLDWSPKYAPESRTLKALATGTEFRRTVWCLEFTFKPVRTIWVDIPQPGGKMQRTLVWYMIYHVRNPGGALRPARNDEGVVTIEPVDREVRFFPQFVLESHEFKKAYLDRIIPTAIQAIQEKEDPNRRLLNSVEIGSQLVPVSTDLVDKSLWGVATWEGVDPRIDFFSVYVEGLTNAYRWVDPEGAFKAGHPPTTGRVLMQKNLMLNFWRPGDEKDDSQGIRFGIPGKVDYSWVYR